MKTSGKTISVLVVVDKAVGGTGPHRNVVGSLNALSSKDNIITTVLCGFFDESEPFAKSGKIKFHTGFNPKKPLLIFSNFFKILSLARRCDVIYVPCGFISALYGSAAAHLLGKKIIIGPNVSKIPFRKQDSPGFLEVGLLTDVWLEASARRKRFVLDHLKPSLHPKVRNILHSIDLAKFNPSFRTADFFKKLNIRSGTLKVLHVGRDNEPIKGVPILIDAIAKINQSYHQNVDFIIVGKMSEATRAKCKDFSNVHFLGFLSGEKLSQAFASADFMVVPSSWENCPFTVLESLASALPVVAFNTGGIPELIESGKTGVLIDGITSSGLHATDASAKLAAEITKLIANPEILKAMSQAARRDAESRFSESRLGQDLSNLFFSVSS